MITQCEWIYPPISPLFIITVWYVCNKAHAYTMSVDLSHYFLYLSLLHGVCVIWPMLTQCERIAPHISPLFIITL